MFDFQKFIKRMETDEANLGPECGKEDAAASAAVLIPLLERARETTVLLTRRSGRLSRHAGQISLPGGRIEESDESCVAAALREAREEIGLDVKRARVLGCLPLYVTPMDDGIIPVAAVVRPPFDFRANPGEVEEIFEIPLSFLCDSRNWSYRPIITVTGMPTKTDSLVYRDYCVWGITAGILQSFRTRLEELCSE